MSTTKPLDSLDVPIVKSRRWGRHALGMLISIICLLFMARKIDFHNLALALSQFQWSYLIYGIFSLSIGYSLRIIRWTLMLKAAGSKVKVTACAAPFLGAIALNNILPLRLGDLVRAFVFPTAIGVDKATATSSLVMERLLDLVTLFACLMLGLVIAKGTQLPDWLANSVVSLVSLSGLALVLVFSFSGKLARHLSSFCAANEAGSKLTSRDKVFRAIAKLLWGFEAMSRLRVLLTLFAISIIAWVCEAGLFWSLLIGFRLETSLALGMMVMAIVTFSTLVPSSPGYIGPFHLAAFAAISILGGTTDQAASFAVLSHLALWIPTTLAGGIAMMLTPELFRSVMIRPNNKKLNPIY